MLILQSCALVFKTVERFSHIRGCKHNWPNHVKAVEGSLRFHGKCLQKGSSVIGFGKVAFSPDLKTLFIALISYGRIIV